MRRTLRFDHFRDTRPCMTKRDTGILGDQYRTFESAVVELETSSEWRDSMRQYRIDGEARRKDLVQKFPRNAWPEMTLEAYALGQEGRRDTWCYELEFVNGLGSIRGGSAQKHVIFKRKRNGDWFYPSAFPNEQAAWEELRSNFVEAFELADRGEWSAIDELDPLNWARVLTLKTLYIYFPDQLLACYSLPHLKKFLGWVGTSESSERYSSAILANRQLLQDLRNIPELSGYDSLELSRFLYLAAHPNSVAKVFQVSPGAGEEAGVADDGELWTRCLAEGLVAVGWPEIGDLRDFENKAAFRKAFGAAYAGRYGQRSNVVGRKANELWRLMDMEPNDFVVANAGKSRILGVGQVEEAAYEWRPDLEGTPHTIAVRWGAQGVREISPQSTWASAVASEVPPHVQREIFVDAAKIEVAPDANLSRLAGALERKKQVVLYGPPGTGKTFTALRFATWWLLQSDGSPEARWILGSPNEQALWEKKLMRGPGNAPRLQLVTFHPSYGYEDFVEGFRPVTQAGPSTGLQLQLEDGVFKQFCRKAAADPERRFLIIIDEINRGNVARILGELLTLLEGDKRGRMVRLAQSKQEFAVPPNVYLIGTMNTADRSIKLLDAALRRRFAFIEMLPEAELLSGVKVGDLELDDFLEELNQRIAETEGREKQIGHSYLLADGKPMREIAQVANAFRYDILPLLQEYTFDDPSALQSLLGDRLVDKNGSLSDLLEEDDALIAALHKLVLEGEGRG